MRWSLRSRLAEIARIAVVLVIYGGGVAACGRPSETKASDASPGVPLSTGIAWIRCDGVSGFDQRHDTPLSDTSVADLREAERRCSDHAINQIFYNGPIDQAFSSLVANAATLTNKSGFTADTSYSRRSEPRGTIGARCRKSDRRRVFCARISTCWIFASGHAASTRLLPLCVRSQQNAGFEPYTRSWWRKDAARGSQERLPFACRKFYSGALDRMKLRTER